MRNIKKCCCNCAYGGWFNPTEKHASCDCVINKERFSIKHLNKNEFVVKCNDWEEENHCKHFIPQVNDEDYIEEDTYSITNLTIKCPYCNLENEVYEVDQSGQSDIIECEHCGKEFGYSWGGLY